MRELRISESPPERAQIALNSATDDSGQPYAQSIGLGEEAHDFLINLKRKWGIYTHGALKQRCHELRGNQYLIADLLPKRSLSIVVGDSGLGKSPLLYQAALSVAEGIPFLGKPVSPGRVLYMDFENGLSGVEKLVSRLSTHLGLPSESPNLFLFNYNDAPPKWTPADFRAMVAEIRPDWIIIDTVSSFAPEIDEKNKCVTLTYQEFRAVMKDYQTTITLVHHLRKPSNRPDVYTPDLETDTRGWFLETRGPRQLINGTDVRIGIDKCRRADNATELDGRSIEVALVLAGFGRLGGTIEPMYVGRILGEDDKPTGYAKLSGKNLLFNQNQQVAFDKLPDSFTFKQAKQIYGRGPQATIDFLNKCQSAGILRKEGKLYKKVQIADSTD